MDIRPIKTDKDYRWALKEVEGLMDALPNSPEGERLDVLTTLIQAYESKRYVLDHADPVAVIQFEMERQNLTAKDLEPIIGRRNRVYEILNGKRNLTLKMIWRLHESLGIPAEALIKPPQTH
jgi:HTH-type transcriptional regulator/antitoxin HigA